jgi:hypothetical protein
MPDYGSVSSREAKKVGIGIQIKAGRKAGCAVSHCRSA